MNRGTLKEKWDEFESMVIPKQAGQDQRDVMKDAFYAGASSMFSLTQEVSEGDEVTPEDMQHMQNLNDELVTYSRSLEIKDAMRNGVMIQ